MRPDGKVCNIVAPANDCELKVPCNEDGDPTKCTFNFTQNTAGDYFIPFKADVAGVSQVSKVP